MKSGSRSLFPLEYKINPDDFTKSKRTINEGRFSSISFYINTKSQRTFGRNTNQEYAKKTSIRPLTKHNKLYFYQGIYNLVKIIHPTIVPFKGFLIEKNIYGGENISIYTKSMKNGSLEDIIEKVIKRQIEFDNTKKQIILVGIARGMMILHRESIIHKNLKPSNILLDENFKPKICDFALSKFYTLNYEGMIPYMAPEVIKDSKEPLKKPYLKSDVYSNHTVKSDVYSFGILMYEIITCHRAYPEELYEEPLKLFDEIKKGKTPYFSLKKIKKKNLRRMIRFCLSKDPHKRPTFSELYNKLSISEEVFFKEPGKGICKPKINDSEYDDDYSDSDDSDDEVYNLNSEDDIQLDNKYCLDDIDIDKFQSYIEEIDSETKITDIDENLVDVRFKNKKSEDFISKLEKEMDDLSKSTEMLMKENKNIKKDIVKSERENQKLRKKSDELRDEASQLKVEISELYEKIKSLTNKHEKIKNSLKPMNQTNVTPPRSPNNGQKSPRHSSNSEKGPPPKPTPRKS